MSLISFISFFVFIPLQIVFLPLAVLGGMLVGYRQVVVSKRAGVSQTAIEILNARWTMHVFGLRADEATAKLAASLPNTSTFGLGLVLFPLWVKYRICGKPWGYPVVQPAGAESLANFIVARTHYFDQIIQRHSAALEQIVLMGAGYDGRAYDNLRLPGVAYFEVDQEAVQSHKRVALAAAGVECGDVTFVPVDFSKDKVFERLAEAGFDAQKKTLFLWEGVTLYLSEADVRQTLRDVKRAASSGSVLVADFYGERLMKMGGRSGVKEVLDATGEGFAFHLPLEKGGEPVLRRFVESESLGVGEVRLLGSETASGAFVAVVEMIV